MRKPTLAADRWFFRPVCSATALSRAATNSANSSRASGTGGRIAGVIDTLRGDGARRRGMAEASRTLGRPRAADAVAALVAEVARKEQV